MTPPAAAEQERARRRDAGFELRQWITQSSPIGRNVDPLGVPAIEPERGAQRIAKRERQTRPRSVYVPAIIIEQIRERAPHLERRPQPTDVETIGKDPSTARQRAIEPLRQANRERLYPLGETLRILGFDEQMDVVRLHGVMNDASVAGSRHAERFTHDAKGLPFAQARKATNQSQSDVKGNMPRYAWTRAV